MGVECNNSPTDATVLAPIRKQLFDITFGTVQLCNILDFSWRKDLNKFREALRRWKANCVVVAQNRPELAGIQVTPTRSQSVNYELLLRARLERILS